jgi:hypothetical protein
MTEAEDLLALGARLADQAGLSSPIGLERLAGGRNNRVFRLDLAGGAAAVLKCYFHDPCDPRDRLAAEWGFIRHAWDRGVRSIPQALACEQASHAALYSLVPGRKLAAGELGAVHVAAALDFIRRINAPSRTAWALQKGSEACFTLTEHLATIERRVARLGQIDPDASHRRRAEAFVAQQLRPTWDEVRSHIVDRAGRLGLGMDEALHESAVCISPSDFGFHNALVDETGGVSFIDFEYAGRDDPAKLVSDFFCQPEVPVPQACYDGFLAGMVEALGLGAAEEAKARMLLDAYRIKWLCIMLNDFLPGDAARRAFADHGSRADRCADRLDKAMRDIALVSGAPLD